MPISSVSQFNYQPYTSASPAAKPDAQEAPASTATTAVTTPDKDQASDNDAKTASDKTASSSSPNMYKINPDGTIGPLHLPRPGHGPGVVHA